MITNPPVKINLGLNVLRKREDGYHDLKTLFYPSSQMSDILEIIRGDDYSRTSSKLSAQYGHNSRIALAGEGQSIVEDDDIPSLSQAISPDGKLMITVAREEGVDWPVLNDLCAKAYFMLYKDFNLPPVKIYLEKKSPVGAGLGSGSADAAYTLKMLSEMFDLGIDNMKLAEYASKLGSDCAFFVWNRPMIGEGRGEILSPYDLNVEITDTGMHTIASGKDRYELKIIAPEGVHVSTAEAYKGIVPSIPSIDIRDVLSLPVEKWKDLLVNDFETTVFKLHPELAAIKQSLYDSGAAYASMSGSGSALFALYKL